MRCIHFIIGPTWATIQNIVAHFLLFSSNTTDFQADNFQKKQTSWSKPSNIRFCILRETFKVIQAFYKTGIM